MPIRPIQIMHTLDYRESRALLDFVLQLKADTFSLVFLTTDPAAVDTQAPFEAKLERYLVGARPFEENKAIASSRWSFNSGTRDLILQTFDGDILLYDCPRMPEDLTIYVGDQKLLEVISHEGILLLELTDDEYSDFRQLQVDHSL
jgi:hypothetical protein